MSVYCIWFSVCNILMWLLALLCSAVRCKETEHC